MSALSDTPDSIVVQCTMRRQNVAGIPGTLWMVPSPELSWAARVTQLRHTECAYYIAISVALYAAK